MAMMKRSVLALGLVALGACADPPGPQSSGLTAPAGWSSMANEQTNADRPLTSNDTIDVETYGGALRISNMPQPAHLVDVQYSIPYCLALVAVVGSQTLLPLTVEALGRDEVTTLARKITLSLDCSLA